MVLQFADSNGTINVVPHTMKFKYEYEYPNHPLGTFNRIVPIM